MRFGVLKRWFWVTSFTGWFGGVNSSQARDALEEIRRLAHDSNTQLTVVDLEAPAQGFPDRFDARSARVRAFLLYLASLGPLSLAWRHTKAETGVHFCRAWGPLQSGTCGPIHVHGSCSRASQIACSWTRSFTDRYSTTWTDWMTTSSQSCCPPMGFQATPAK